MVKIDLKDRRILYELDRNARQSNSEIAKKVRLNKNTVTYKINRMIEEKIISGFYTVIDNARLGYFSFRIYLKYFNTTKEIEEQMIEYLKNHPQIGVVAKIETMYDLDIQIWVKSIYEFDTFWFAFKKKFRSYFWNEKVDVYQSVYHFKRKYLLEDAKYDSYEYIGVNEPVAHDDTDLKILEQLTRNVRIPLSEMSLLLKIPPRTIAYRMKQMEKNKVIQAYRVNPNLQALGYEYYKINIILQSYDNYESLMQFSKQHPYIMFIDRTLSHLDFEIDVEIPNRQMLLALIDEMKLKFKIRDAEIFTIKEYYKLELMPVLHSVDLNVEPKKAKT